jgi:hypothetical protein
MSQPSTDDFRKPRSLDKNRKKNEQRCKNRLKHPVYFDEIDDYITTQKIRGVRR